VAAGRLLDAVVGIASKPSGLSRLEILSPVADVIGKVGVVPGVHTTAFTRQLHRYRDIGSPFSNAHLHERSSIGWVRRIQD